MTGTYARHKTNEGQLRPLEDRVTDKQMERRTQKMATRIGRDHALTRGAVVQMGQILSRGLFGRLKWLLVGR